jgi:uncharacterized protein (TIGR00251 family)
MKRSICQIKIDSPGSHHKRNLLIMEKAVIEITVSPKSSQSKIVVNEEDTIKVYLNSPPVDGKANAELLKILSKTLGIAKSGIEIIRGQSGRKKTLRIAGLDKSMIIEKLKGQ